MPVGRSVEVEVDGSIATIVLNRPQQRNAVNGPLLDDLMVAIKEIETDEAIRVVLLRGAGPAFCAGNDLKERAALSVEELRDRRAKGHSAYKAIEQLAKPCIAVVHGPAVAAGCEIAFATDFVIAGDSASFRYPVAVRGSLRDALWLPRIVGRAMAKELLFTGRVVDAPEALGLRMVNRVVPDEQLLSVARDIAATIAENRPEGMSAIKRAIDDGKLADSLDVQMLEQAAIEAAREFQNQRST